MKIFISYSHDDRDVAEEIQLRLTGEGNDVFFDREDLPAGEEFDAAIVKEIEDCDLFIFLVSPSSVAEGKYTLTELEFTRKRWKYGGGHVLPVMVRETAWAQVPKYLTAVTVLSPEGNIAAEVAETVRKWRWRTLAKPVNQGLMLWCFVFAYLVVMWLWPGLGTLVVVSALAAVTLLGTHRLRYLRDWSVTRKILGPAAVAMTVVFFVFWSFTRTSVVRLVPNMALMSMLPAPQSDTSQYRMLVDGDVALPQSFGEGVVMGVGAPRWRALANAETDATFSEVVQKRLEDMKLVVEELRREGFALDSVHRDSLWSPHQYIPDRFRWPVSGAFSVDIESDNSGLDSILEASVHPPLQVSRDDCEPFEAKGLVSLYVLDAWICFLPNDAWPASQSDLGPP